MLEGLLLPIILALLSGGGLVGFLTYRIAKRKAPAEIDSIVVQSAETANLSLSRSLEAETKRAERLAAEVARKDERITLLETTIATLYRTIDELRATVDRISVEVQSLRRGN